MYPPNTAIATEAKWLQYSGRNAGEKQGPVTQCGEEELSSWGSII